MPIVREERNERGQVTYRKYNTGYWVEREYDENGRETYFKNSKGYWEKREFDKNGKVTYSENSKGICVKRKYNKNGKMIYSYHKNSDGSWEKQKFDDNGRLIRYKNSNGSLQTWEYDKNGRLIYVEDSNGVLLDKRESKEHFKDLNEKNENQEIAFLFDGTKIGERSQSFNDGYVIINARTKDEAVETFKAQYGRGQHNEALCTEVVSDFNRVEQIKSSDLPCHNYIDLTKSQEQNQSNTEEQTDGRK